MHGRAGEERKRGRHMWTVPSRVTEIVAGGGSSSSSSSSANSFFKDGRKISVGDCALFKPPKDCPPFIGIIRWLTAGKENKLKLGVNWLYRSVEVKLGKGILLEAAPNEIFYSFHKDEIPAASLLHPCKVAFLPKGAELPSGICSFVCRRVYDITNKCLWWLTDQDYINERQEEVDQLLYKTRIEMHATVQPGGRSPKPLNVPTSTSLKPGSDSLQNSASSIPSQVKGKKRERGDHGFESVKRERSVKMEDGDSGHHKPEHILRPEIAKITEKGGLVDSDGVDKLVQLMMPERNEKKIDLGGRSILAGVIASTEKFDCLSRFVQLRGLPVFDEWLQEVHKGKVGDGGGSKDSEKSIEDFLLVLLRALDKLPVNLHALQMCNIGKSVNHLRSHKNSEIQKKARSLVDTWKKRVEAEMDAKSGSSQAVSWSARPRLPEVPHSGNRHSGGSSEVVVKSSVTQLSASKTVSVKLIQGDTTNKSSSVSPGSMKSGALHTSVNVNLKDGQLRSAAVGGTSDLPVASLRDEKSSSSSQSHNNSQSCSSDHAKTGGIPGKEDARSSTAGSMTVSKVSGVSSRHRKSSNGFPGSGLSAVQRETGSSRGSSLNKNLASEKTSQSSLTCEKALDVPVSEGNSHKFIVKIPNRGRSPAQSASGGSFEDPLVMNSRASSPVLSEKHDQFDHNLKEKNDVYRGNIASDVNTESWQSNDFKDVLTGSDEGDGSPATLPDEEHGRSGDDARRITDIPKVASSSSGNEFKSGKLHESSFSSMNALIESCVKYSNANASLSIGDDVGMNLLASVAAGEMDKSDIVSPNGSPNRDTPVSDHCCTVTDSRLRSSTEGELAGDGVQSSDSADVQEMQGIVAGAVWDKNVNGKITSLNYQKPAEELCGRMDSSSVDLQQSVDRGNESVIKSREAIAASVAVPCPNTVENNLVDGGTEPLETNAGGGVVADEFPDAKQKVNCSSLTEVVINDPVVEVINEANEGSFPYMENDRENREKVNERLNNDVRSEQKPPPSEVHSEFVKGSDGELLPPFGSVKNAVLGDDDKIKIKEDAETKSLLEHSEKLQTEVLSTVSLENRVAAGPGSAVALPKGEDVENLNGEKSNKQGSGGVVPPKVSPIFPVQEAVQRGRSRVSKQTSPGADEADECTSTATDAPPLSAARRLDVDAKVEFDLNEGFNADDGTYNAPECPAAAQVVSPLPLSVSPAPIGLPASITIAAAAKGPFVPPEELLKNKGELGWKGSAATSAFRPAEPRKFFEVPLSTANISPPESASSKHSRAPLDIDLNVPDERILEVLASQSSTLDPGSVSHLANKCGLAHDGMITSEPARFTGGLDLDLNRADEPSDVGTTSSARRLDVQLLSAKSLSGGLNSEAGVRRDFDLNDGPVVDDANAEPSPFSQQMQSSVPSQPPVSGLRMHSVEIGNFSSWFPAGNTYSAVTIPSILPDRGEQPFPIIAGGGPQRMMAPPTGATPFTPDVYRGPVLSSSPAVPFPSAPFQYPVFPFGTSFPVPSANFSGGSTAYIDSSSSGRLVFPPVHSQFLGSSGAVPSHYPRPYVLSLPNGGNNNGAESSRKWGRQGLDLNAGPGVTDVEGREEMLPLAPRQLSVANPQSLMEEQARMYQGAGGVWKRKEPEGGWDAYKQSPWQ